MPNPAPAKYVYTPGDAVLAAGTQTQFRLKSATAWTPVKGVLAIGIVGDKSATVDQTTLEDTAKRFTGGLFEGQDKEFKGKFYPADAGQTAFFTAAKENQIVVIMHVWPDNTTAQYEVALLGYMRDETQPEAHLGWVVPGKQNGKVEWGTVGA